MRPNVTESRYLARQVAYARPIFMILAVVDLLEIRHSRGADPALVFIIGYLVAAVVIIAAEYLLRKKNLHLPLVVDLAALAVFLVLSPSEVAVWFPYLFVAFAAGIRWGMRWAVILAAVMSLSLVVKTAWHGSVHWPMVISWVVLLAPTFAAGPGLAFLGDLSSRHSSESEFLARLTEFLSVDQGMSESMRLMLDELARGFRCQLAYLAFRDSELERIFIWKVRAGETERIAPENLPLTRADAYLLDDLDATVCWNDLTGPGDGFGWDRRDARRLAASFSVALEGNSRCRICAGSKLSFAISASLWRTCFCCGIFGRGPLNLSAAGSPVICTTAFCKPC